MTTPSGSSRSTGPVSTSHPPPLRPPSRKRKKGKKGAAKRKIATTSPSSSASVSTSPADTTARSTSATSTQSVRARKTTPASNPPASTPTAPPGSAPTQPKSELEARFENTKNKLADIMSKFWLYDQVSIAHELASLTPEQANVLADKLQIVIKIQMPGTNKVVQLIPKPTNGGSFRENRETAAYKFLKDNCEALHKRLSDIDKPSDLYDRYVMHRTKVFEIGKELATTKGEIFDYEKDVYVNMLTRAFDHKTMENGVSFEFSRGNPDPSKYKDPGNLNALPPPKSKKKKKKPAGKPKVEFRIAADKDDLKALEDKARARAKRGSGDDSFASVHESKGSLPSSSASGGELGSSHDGSDSL